MAFFCRLCLQGVYIVFYAKLVIYIYVFDASETRIDLKPLRSVIFLGTNYKPRVNMGGADRRPIVKLSCHASSYLPLPFQRAIWKSNEDKNLSHTVKLYLNSHPFFQKKCKVTILGSLSTLGNHPLASWIKKGLLGKSGGNRSG